MKKIIAYFSLKNSSSEKIQSTLQHCLSKKEFVIQRSFSTFSRTLKQPGNGWHIALLAADNPNELDKILSIYELISDLRILLVLSDRHPEMISKGLQLVPRLIMYEDGDFKELAAVLEKMIRGVNLIGPKNKPLKKGVKFGL